MSSGSIIKRGSTYSVVLDLGPDPATGKRRQKWHSGYKTKKEAERARNKLATQVDEGLYVAPTRQTFAEFVADWLPAVEPTLRPSTFHSYSRNLKVLVLPRIGALRLVQLDAGVLNKLYADLAVDGRADGKGGLSPRTIRYVHTILHRALKDAVRWGRLGRNPADAADPPKPRAQGAADVQAWDAATLMDFLERSEASKDRYFAAWSFLASTGVRRGEALGLRWSDVDLDAGTAAIVQTVICVNHAVQIGTPKTSKGRRSIALDADTVQVLRAHRAEQNAERLVIGAGWRNLDLVFPRVDGDPAHPERVSREFDRRVERWELPRISLHGLRHTWATLALSAGVHPKVVSERLGHANITITLDTYSHVTPTMQADAAETVAALLRR